MQPAKYNMICKQGTTFRRTFTFMDGSATPAIIDLSGYSARMQVREDFDSTEFIVELTTENSGISIDGVNGKVSLVIEADVTETFPIGSYKYDIELVIGTEVECPLYGKFKVTAEVTK